MTADLRAVLALDVMQRARPLVAHGRHLLDRTVRWVHTSELVEAAALLKGGELLLTTGLGLAGRGPVAQRSYAEALAANGAAALVLELGWTFPTVPQPLLEAARQVDLPLIALQDIVPFVEMTEEIQTRVLQSRLAELTVDREVAGLVRAQMLQGDGLDALAAALADLLQCPVVLEQVGGEVVACGGLSRPEANARLIQTQASHTAAVEVAGARWGTLRVYDAPTAIAPLIEPALSHGAAAVALTLLHTRQPPSAETRQREEFFADLMSRRLSSPAAVTERGAALGFHVPPDGFFTAFALGGYPAEAEEAVASAASALDHGALVADLDGLVLGLMRTEKRHDTRDVAARLLDSMDALLRRRRFAQPVRLALGPSVQGAGAVGRSLREAKAALEAAVELGIEERVVTARAVAADRLLAGASRDPQLADLAEDVLEPLLRYDEMHDTELVKTLRVYLLHASAKATVAEALHIRRQTLYQRLARIEELVGPLDDADARLSLLVALKVCALRQRRSRPR